MSLPQYSGVTVDVLTNQALPGATVAVYETGTLTLAVLWADAGEVTPLPNPFTSDADTGQFTFFVAAGAYDLTVTKVGATSYTVPNIQVAVIVGAVVQQGAVVASHLAVWVGDGAIEDGGAPLVIGTTAGTACEGDDARLSDTRVPTDASVTAAKMATSMAAIRLVTITLSDAQIKALGAGTPVTAIVQGGAGVMGIPLFGCLTTNFAAGAYTNIDAAAWFGILIASTPPVDLLSYIPNDTLITTGSTTRLTDLLGSTTPKRQLFTPTADTEDVDEWGPLTRSHPRTDTDNATVVIKVDNNGAGAFTGGNAANTATITLGYLLLGAAQ
jgi:hypothetical protein